MPLRHGKHTLLLGILAIFLICSQITPLHALTEFDRQTAIRKGATNTPTRFNYMTHTTFYRSAKKPPCVPFGLAHCLGPQPDTHSQGNRYHNPLADQKNIDPRLRQFYKYKTVESF
jgi:hypothetical protein